MKRFCSLLAIAGSIAFAQVGRVREEKGIEYQPLPIRQYLDVALPEGAGPFPAVLLLHGGGFRSGSRSDVSDLRLRLAREPASQSKRNEC